MVARVRTFAFLGIDTVDVGVEVKLSHGVTSFNIVGLPDKAVNEAKERIRASINSMGLSFPSRRLTINLSPASINKEGSYLDLPMAIGLLVEMGVLEQEVVDRYIVIGELSLDGTINVVNGILPAAINAVEKGLGLICPQGSAREALWADENIDMVAADSLLTAVNFLNGRCKVERPAVNRILREAKYPDLKDVWGQRQAKRALEIAAAGGHNLLMVGPPGSGKSMLAQRILGIMPDLTAREILEINMINSVAGKLVDGEMVSERPFLDPHHSCSMAAMVGGGAKPKPGQISLAHNGILFLDELPEFSKQVLDSLRQPLETGKISIARAFQDITYPAKFQLVAAMNPCRCGYFSDASRQCRRAPVCAREYQEKISGPILDRIDLFVDVPRVDVSLCRSKKMDTGAETSAEYRTRVAGARKMQSDRFGSSSGKLNAQATSEEIEMFMGLDEASENMLDLANRKYGFSMRVYSKIIRIARTIADLEGNENIVLKHIGESLMFRQAEFLVRN
ncbi:MAG: YifB family Mg chelatase-like AAA ATPase [Rickettsiales bacterium]|jgi:magnesium chelatase family protein|nr:YifB family Mg chelatase-like AAA ATPase [Rickettsiales bacterium]